MKSVNISLVSGPGLAFRIINWDELTFGPWVSPFPLIYIPFNIGERVRAWINLRASGSDPQTIIKTYESEWNTLHWLANCTVLNPLGTQVWWLWQYLCSEVRHTLGVILFCPLRVNITGYLWNLLTHSTHPLTGPHVNTICGLLEFRELSQSTTGGQQKTFDKMIFFCRIYFSSIKCFFSLHCMDTPMFPWRQ